MAATREDIKQWFLRGRDEGATHMIVVCDTYDHDDYPVYIAPDQDVREQFAEYAAAPMQKVMEVYSLKMDLEEQLNEFRALHYD